jgi:hypothetical protein
MALYSELPVYKLGYDLLLTIYERTKVFPREHKYSLGERLKNETLELLINIYMANKSKKEERLICIDNARQHLEIVRLLLRVTKDIRVIGIKGYVVLNMQVEELSKQLVSWHKYTAGAHA